MLSFLMAVALGGVVMERGHNPSHVSFDLAELACGTGNFCKGVFSYVTESSFMLAPKGVNIPTVSEGIQGSLVGPSESRLAGSDCGRARKSAWLFASRMQNLCYLVPDLGGIPSVGKKLDRFLRSEDTGVPGPDAFISWRRATVFEKHIKRNVERFSVSNHRSMKVVHSDRDVRPEFTARRTPRFHQGPYQKASSNHASKEAPGSPISSLFRGISGFPLGAKIGIPILFAIGATFVLARGVIRFHDVHFSMRRQAAWGILPGLIACLISFGLWEIMVVRG